MKSYKIDLILLIITSNRIKSFSDKYTTFSCYTCQNIMKSYKIDLILLIITSNFYHHTQHLSKSRLKCLWSCGVWLRQESHIVDLLTGVSGGVEIGSPILRASDIGYNSCKLTYDAVFFFDRLKGLVGFKETSRYYLKMMCLKVYKGH